MSFNEKESEVELAYNTKNLDPDVPKANKDIVKTILINALRVIGLLACLYFFIVALDLMSSGFRLVAGKQASEFLSSEYVLQNPVTGLMIGVIVTVLVQSSSTSTSIIVSMVGAEVMTVRQAIPVVMGANIGTSITSTIVSLGQVGNLENFKRAFAGATIHDCFNLLCVIVFLPLEVVSGYLEKFSGVLVEAMIGNSNSTNINEVEFLSVVTDPLSKLIIQLDKSVFSDLATNKTNNKTLIKHMCKKEIDGETIQERCFFLFESASIPEWSVGLIITISSLVLLSSCLVGMVKILSSVFKGPVAKVVTKVVNYEPDNCLKHGTHFIAMLVGCFFTILVQSSSVFTSTIVPLVGLGMVSLDRVLPMVLGANIGTTFTGILAALASDQLRIALQIALCHTLFNISGIISWYPIPFLRKVPIKMATFLGKTSANYRWFAIAYMIAVFIAIPLFVFGLSVAGPIASGIVGGLLCLLIITILVVNLMQKRKPEWLPEFLRTWKFLPLFMRSLKPYDDILMKLKCCNSKVSDAQGEPDIEYELKESENYMTKF